MLIGFMGAGKTSAGRIVARTLMREFVDTDELIEAAAGTTINEVFQREGEVGFRAREARAVDLAVSSPNRVIAVGGGAILSTSNRTALKQAGMLVYLRATAESLTARLRDVSDRPPARSAGPGRAHPRPVGRARTDLRDRERRDRRHRPTHAGPDGRRGRRLVPDPPRRAARAMTDIAQVAGTASLAIPINASSGSYLVHVGVGVL